MNRRIGQSARHAAAAFTLIEVTVALIIVVLLATMITPQFTRTERRRFDALVEQVGDMMIMYAQRDRLDRKTVGIYYDAERRWLTLVLLDDPDAPDTDEFGWRVDPTVPPVKLPDTVTDVYAYEDGVITDISRWPITNRNDQRRPTIELEILSEQFNATLSLSPQALSPRVQMSDSGRRVDDGVRQSINLDAGGRNREEW